MEMSLMWSLVLCKYEKSNRNVEEDRKKQFELY